MGIMGKILKIFLELVMRFLTVDFFLNILMDRYDPELDAVLAGSSFIPMEASSRLLYEGGANIGLYCNFAYVGGKIAPVITKNSYEAGQEFLLFPTGEEIMDTGVIAIRPNRHAIPLEILTVGLPVYT